MVQMVASCNTYSIHGRLASCFVHQANSMYVTQYGWTQYNYCQYWGKQPIMLILLIKVRGNCVWILLKHHTQAY